MYTILFKFALTFLWGIPAGFGVTWFVGTLLGIKAPWCITSDYRCSHGSKNPCWYLLVLAVPVIGAVVFYGYLIPLTYDIWRLKKRGIEPSEKTLRILGRK